MGMSHEGVNSNVMEFTEPYYIGNLANKIEQHVLQGNEVTTEFVNDVYSQKHLFGNIINDLLR